MAFQDIVFHNSQRGKRRSLNSAIEETPIKISHIYQKGPITITLATVMISNRKHRQWEAHGYEAHEMVGKEVTDLFMWFGWFTMVWF